MEMLSKTPNIECFLGPEAFSSSSQDSVDAR